MVESSENFRKVFEILREYCSNKLHLKHANSDDIVIRSDIKNLSEALLFVEAYETITHSRFSVSCSRTGIKRLVFRKKWVCQRRITNKKCLKSAEKCTAKINIFVKKITKYSKHRDVFLNLDPPLPAVIRISPYHNHTLMDRLSLKLLRISREAKECFYEYFKRGISGVKAKRFHEQNLLKANFNALDDASMNPSLSAIYALYKKWRNLKENVQLHKVPVAENSKLTHDLNAVAGVSNHSPSGNIGIVSKFESESENEDSDFEKMANQVLADLKHGEENLELISPLNIKQEIKEEIDDDFELPIITNCCSLAPNLTNSAMPPPMNIVRPPPTNSARPPPTNSARLSPTNSAMPLTINNTMLPPRSNVVSANYVPTKASYVTVLKVKPVNTQLVLYNKSSNTYKIVKYLSVCSPTSPSVYSSNQYSSYFPNRIQLPTRIGVHKL